MLSHDREVWYLYNGFLMDDVGDTMQGQPHAFHSLNDAKEWAARQDFDIEIKAGTRKGDRILEVAALDASGNPRAPIDPSKVIRYGVLVDHCIIALVVAWIAWYIGYAMGQAAR